MTGGSCGLLGALHVAAKSIALCVFCIDAGFDILKFSRDRCGQQASALVCNSNFLFYLYAKVESRQVNAGLDCE